MNQYLISVKVENYIKEFFVSSFGHPVQLPRDSPEARIIKRFLEKQPEDYDPDEEENLLIIIPDSKEKPRDRYNYLNKAAKAALVESLETIFIQNMWTELSDMNNLNCSLTNVIYAYMEKHGISEEHWETIRQKYYRLRKRYQKAGIKLSVKEI